MKNSYDDDGNPCSMSINDQTYYYVVNDHGNVVALTDGSGEVVASYEYDAWGNIISKTGQLSDINPYRYAGTGKKLNYITIVCVKNTNKIITAYPS